MANSKNFERQLALMEAGQAPGVVQKGIDEIIDEAVASINASNPNAASLRDLGQRAFTEGWTEHANMRTMVESDELSDAGRTKQIQTWRQKYGASLDALQTQMMRAVGNVRALVLPYPPDFAPSNPTEAAHINGVMADFESYDPATASRIARDAIARKNLPLAKRIADKLGAWSTYRRPFVDNGVVGDVLAELAAALTTADMIRSTAAQQWADNAESDVNFLIRELRNSDGAFDPVYITTGSLPTVFANRVAPKSYAITRLSREDGLTNTL